MALQKRKGRVLTLLKTIILVVFCLAIATVLSCDFSGTNSTSSSGGSSGTGSGWTVDVTSFASTVSISRAETTTVIVLVKDGTGAPAPRGTRICLSTSYGLIWVDEIGKDEPVRTGCFDTSNEIGQLFGTYVPQSTGTDYVQATSQGAFGSRAIEVVP